MFRRGKVCSRHENNAPEQARRREKRRSTRGPQERRVMSTKQTKKGNGKNTKHRATHKRAYSWVPPKPKSMNMEPKHTTLSTDKLRLLGVVKRVKRAYSWAPPKPKSMGTKPGETRRNKPCLRHACSHTLYMSPRTMINTVKERSKVETEDNM